MNKVEEIKQELLQNLKNIKTIDELNNLKVEYLGKKGKITQLSNLIKEIDKEDRKDFGIKLNKLKNIFNENYTNLLDKLNKELVNKK